MAAAPAKKGLKTGPVRQVNLQKTALEYYECITTCFGNLGKRFVYKQTLTACG